MGDRFESLVEQVLENPVKKRCAVVWADATTRQAVREAESRGLVEAVYFYSEQERGDELAGQACPSPREAAAEAVRAVRSGDCDMILKGNLETALLLKEVVNKDYGLTRGRLISHVALLDLSAYHKLLLLSDGGMVMYPDQEQLRAILTNAVEVMHGLGIHCPKVALLAAVEKVHQSMPETVRAAALKAMNESGLIQGCQVEGPISFDLAFDREAARLKGYESPVAGDADVFLVPDFVAGNLLAKSLVYAGGAHMAGFLWGARSPVILTSRSTPAKEKLYSIACAALLAGSQA